MRVGHDVGLPRPWCQTLIVPLLLLSTICTTTTDAAPVIEDELIDNITRLDKGDVFFVTGGECGVTRCEEASGGTAFSERPPGTAGPPCACRCPRANPLFREDKVLCSDHVSECPLSQFGRVDGVSRAPLVFLPLSGQIIHPSNELYFPDSENTICAVSNAQFLTKGGWSNLREEVDNDVPFSLFRDEGKTFLRWTGTEDSRSKITGRVVVVRLACRAGQRSLLPCAAFRIQGSPVDLHNGIPEIQWSSRGGVSEASASPAGMGVSLLLCALAATLLYAGTLLLYLRGRRRRRHLKPPSKVEDPRDVDMPNTTTNPLLSLLSRFSESRSTSCQGGTDGDDSSRSSSTQSLSAVDSLDRHTQEDDQHEESGESEESVVSATIHQLKRYSPGVSLGQSCFQALVERRPEIHVDIFEKAEQIHGCESTPTIPPPGSIRRKLYFNPAFLDPQMLKNPPPAAIDFLTKIREVITIAKDKMLTKRFMPTLPTILEEIFCHEINLNFSIDTLKTSSVFSLKRENSRRKKCCGGCPGCKISKKQSRFLKTLSEKEFCKSCVSGEAKDNIVKKWLERVPIADPEYKVLHSHHEQSISKIVGTPKSILPLEKIDRKIKSESVEMNSHKDKSPPLPPERTSSLCNQKESNHEDEEKNKLISIRKRDEDIITIPISPELKKKMNAVINELSKFRRVDPIIPRIPSPVSEVVTPFIPKLVIPVTPKVVDNFSSSPEVPKPISEARTKKNKLIRHTTQFDIDSLERCVSKRRASLSNIDSFDIKFSEPNPRGHKRRSSIIAMEELEPMKKIYEMNSRLSRSYQGLDATSQAVENINNNFSEKECKSYAIQRSNLVSEVYINDYINTMSSTSDSDYSTPNSSLKIKYAEPLTKPGQLVIEVDNTNNNKIKQEEDNFDPDTLDRKHRNSRSIFVDKNVSEKPIPRPKNIEHIFLKSSGSFKTRSLTGFEDPQENIAFERKTLGNLLNNNNNGFFKNNLHDYNKLKIPEYSKTIESRHLQIPSNDYENCILNSMTTGFPMEPKSLSSIFLEKKEDIKPPLPPKKIIGKRTNCTWNQQNTFRVHVNKDNLYTTSNYGNSSTYRISRSEPPQLNTDISMKPYFHNPLVQTYNANQTSAKNMTCFGNLKSSYYDDELENRTFRSLDPSYENYSRDEKKKEEIAKNSENENIQEKENQVFSMRRPNRKSSKFRQKKSQHSKHHKTEDSGYLSSDSNESRHKKHFILQVRDKDDNGNDNAMVSDTDDLESIGDARSESGGESIETNSVFFGSLRRLSSLKKEIQECDEVTGISSEILKVEEGKELRKVISIISPQERLAALDDL